MAKRPSPPTLGSQGKNISGNKTRNGTGGKRKPSVGSLVSAGKMKNKPISGKK